MTSRSTWKAFERTVAASLGTNRTPLSGLCSRHTSSDTLHSRIFAECKYRQRWQVWTLYEAVKKQAIKEAKIPALFLKEKGRKGYLVCFHSDDWLQLVKEYGLGNGRI